jgi:hypothetical protein
VRRGRKRITPHHPVVAASQEERGRAPRSTQQHASIPPPLLAGSSAAAPPASRVRVPAVATGVAKRAGLGPAGRHRARDPDTLTRTRKGFRPPPVPWVAATRRRATAHRPRSRPGPPRGPAAAGPLTPLPHGRVAPRLGGLGMASPTWCRRCRCARRPTEREEEGRCGSESAAITESGELPEMPLSSTGRTRGRGGSGAHAVPSLLVGLSRWAWVGPWRREAAKCDRIRRDTWGRQRGTANLQCMFPEMPTVSLIPSMDGCFQRCLACVSRPAA